MVRIIVVMKLMNSIPARLLAPPPLFQICPAFHEDDLYLDDGVVAPSNAALIERAVPIVRSPGEDVATPDEARELLALASSRGSAGEVAAR